MTAVVNSDMNADMNVTGGCSFCGQWSTNLLKCGRCKGVFYCSRDCQRGDWKEGHREHCNEETTYFGKYMYILTGLLL